MLRIFRKNQAIPKLYQRCVATLGNFDGVHRGHQAIFDKMKSIAKRHHAKTVVILFEPQPLEFFNQGKSPARLTRLREKLFWCEHYGIDGVLVLPFNEAMALCPAEQFVELFLVKNLQIVECVVGEDCRFGHDRLGDVNLLQSMGKAYNFRVTVVDALKMNNHQRISSTALREAMKSDVLGEVESMLGRPYSLQGRVKHGKKLGRQLGFPTANICLHREVVPLQGIYTVWLYGVEGRRLASVANVGTRPTINGTETLLEVYVLDWEGELYGRHVTVEFCTKLRPEERYDNLNLLAIQIAKDVEKAKDYFRNRE
jgi:riboflavin kinase/FMN adenylyltransferase